ncbi:hypothetical protein GTR04_0210 [Trichophyton interdigitale]|uniref:Uncharacterized protein n=1 Tax=Trichophyton interdigitale TaxID=101480 RepID=A0A9P4YQG9_9EURO|nr:hypothetical protein GY631_1270 [Trichophyton interdigitale]KAF3901253.1 hypothetical protein GY632_0024 [Trichophyton interdigitale]KAG8212383.1 hypothetical protein GTR04_0210 [Trichophyton interdigitale]
MFLRSTVHRAAKSVLFNTSCLSAPKLSIRVAGLVGSQSRRITGHRIMEEKRGLSQIDDPNGHVRMDLKSHFPWGWVVYRTSYSDEEAWQKMLNILREKVEKSLQVYERMDLLPFHEMIIMDDKAKFEGATSHDIRDHFTGWVADTVAPKMITALSESAMKQLRDPYKEDHSLEWFLGARYNFCLFIDDICLESMEHMRRPVVKMLAKNFGARKPEDRNYAVYPGWEDGETEEGDEEVGWMYIWALEIVSQYDEMMETDFWYTIYNRPPRMWNNITDITPGSWRKGQAK